MNIFDLDKKYKIISLAILFVISFIAFVYSYSILKTDFLFSSIFIMPIVLACLWFGYRGFYITFALILTMILANIIAPYEYFQLGFVLRLLVYIAISAIISSVTEIRNNTQEELQLSRRMISEDRNKYRTLVENLPQKVFLKDSNHRWVSGNQRFLNDLNMTEEELSGKTDYDSFPKELADKYKNDDMRILKTGVTEELDEMYIEGEQERIVHTVKTAVKNDNGENIGILGIFWDITEQKRAEKELLIKNYAVESSLSPIAMSDFQGTLTYVNPSFLKTWGYNDLKGVIGRPNEEFTPMGEVKEIMQALQEVGFWSGEVIGVKKDGTKFNLQLGATTIKDKEGAPFGLMASFIDITDKKIAEQKLIYTIEDLKRSNKELEQFAYVASHDLQEPLRKVKSFSELLESRYKAQLDEKAKKYIEYIVDSSTRMQILINDLLGFSRVGTRGKQLEPTDANEVLHEIIDTFQITIQNKNVQINYDKLPTVMADSGQLFQLFQNLIGNGIKFNENSVPTIDITAKQKDEMWEFSVKDNGIGVEEQYFDKIFGVFQTLHARDKYEGTGIGLAICKKIVERHGGKIWLESEVGKGTTFYFTLPSVKEEI